MAIDHIDPIIPVTGFTTWDDLIGALFCEADKMQVICKKPCHADKTKKENAERRKNANRTK